MARNGTEQVRHLQRTLYRTAKQSKAVKFYSLYDKVWRSDVLWEAWKQVKENRGAPGVDGETIEGIVSRGEEGLMLSRLQDQLRAKTYRFQPVRRVDIPKPKGGTRPLGIATVEDRVVLVSRRRAIVHAVRKMKEGPSEPPCRRRLQTAISCFGPKIEVVNVMVKRRDRRSRHVWIREMSANDPLMKHRNLMEDTQNRDLYLVLGTAWKV